MNDTINEELAQAKETLNAPGTINLLDVARDLFSLAEAMAQRINDLQTRVATLEAAVLPKPQAPANNA